MLAGKSTSVVATVGGTGRAWPEPTNFAQYSEQNTLRCPAQISPRLHFSNDGPHTYINMNNYVEPLALGGLFDLEPKVWFRNRAKIGLATTLKSTNSLYQNGKCMKLVRWPWLVQARKLIFERARPLSVFFQRALPLEKPL